MDSLLISFANMSIPEQGFRIDQHLQSRLIADVLDSEHFRKYPPSQRYQRKFWKHLVESIEGLGEVRSILSMAVVYLLSG